MEIPSPHSNRLGQFNVTYEAEKNDREMLKALFALCVVQYVEPHESGRGKTFYCTSETLFQPLAEGEAIPEYRIECELAKPFTEEENAKATASGPFKFYAVRKIIVRVPPAQIGARPHRTAVH